MGQGGGEWFWGHADVEASGHKKIATCNLRKRRKVAGAQVCRNKNNPKKQKEGKDKKSTCDEEGSIKKK